MQIWPSGGSARSCRGFGRHDEAFRGVAEVGDGEPDAALQGGLVGDDAGHGEPGGGPGVDRRQRAGRDGSGEVVDQEVVAALVPVWHPVGTCRAAGCVVHRGRGRR